MQWQEAGPRRHEAGPPGRRHRGRGRTNEARPLMQEAQRRRQGYWEGGQARGWIQEAVGRR